MELHDRPLNPMADIFVRYLLGSENNKDILIDFINAVFVQKGHDLVIEIDLLNPFNLKTMQNSKESILDVRAKDSRGRWINVEIQIDSDGSYANRSLYYWAKSYAGQLKKGDIYPELNPSICINLLDFEIFPQLPGYHSCFQITEKDAPEFVLTEHLQIHFIEVPKKQIESANDVRDKLDTWCFYFKNEGKIAEEHMTVLLKDNPAIGRAHEVYQEFTNNEELMDMAEAREKWQKDVNSKLHSAEQRGKEAGIQEGIQEGIQQGIQEGIQQARLEDAQRMLAEGIDISTVQRITGLSENQVLELKDN